MKFLSLASMLLISSFTFSPAQAQFAKPEDAIKYRQSALAVMGTHFSRLAGMAQGKIPYDAKAAADAATIKAAQDAADKSARAAAALRRL